MENKKTSLFHYLLGFIFFVLAYAFYSNGTLFEITNVLILLGALIGIIYTGR